MQDKPNEKTRKNSGDIRGQDSSDITQGRGTGASETTDLRGGRNLQGSQQGTNVGSQQRGDTQGNASQQGRGLRSTQEEDE